MNRIDRIREAHNGKALPTTRLQAAQSIANEYYQYRTIVAMCGGYGELTLVFADGTTTTVGGLLAYDILRHKE